MVEVACADWFFSIITTLGTIFPFYVICELFLTSMFYKLEKGKHCLKVEYCLKYFCNLSSLAERALKDCIALFGAGANQDFCRCIFWQENNLNVKVLVRVFPTGS